MVKKIQIINGNAEVSFLHNTKIVTQFTTASTDTIRLISVNDSPLKDGISVLSLIQNGVRGLDSSLIPDMKGLVKYSVSPAITTVVTGDREVHSNIKEIFGRSTISFTFFSSFHRGTFTQNGETTEIPVVNEYYNLPNGMRVNFREFHMNSTIVVTCTAQNTNDGFLYLVHEE